jgi:hypothetical protein
MCKLTLCKMLYTRFLVAILIFSWVYRSQIVCNKYNMQIPNVLVPKGIIVLHQWVNKSDAYIYNVLVPLLGIHIHCCIHNKKCDTWHIFLTNISLIQNFFDVCYQDAWFCLVADAGGKIMWGRKLLDWTKRSILPHLMLNFFLFLLYPTIGIKGFYKLRWGNGQLCRHPWIRPWFCFNAT